MIGPAKAMLRKARFTVAKVVLKVLGAPASRYGHLVFQEKVRRLRKPNPGRESRDRELQRRMENSVASVIPREPKKQSISPGTAPFLIPLIVPLASHEISVRVRRRTALPAMIADHERQTFRRRLQSVRAPV